MLRTMFKKILYVSLLCSAALFVAGCATNDVPKDDNASFAETLKATREARNIPALMNAPTKSLAVCTSMQPMSVQLPFKSILFNCAEINVQATIDEMRDAGWRAECVDIGKPENTNGVVGMSLKLTMRKIF